MDIYIVQALSAGLSARITFVSAALLLALLTIVAVRLNILTAKGSVAAFAFGMFFLGVGGLPYLLLMVFFVTIGALSTRYRIREKRWQNVSEGVEGERGEGNVLAHVLIPSLLISLLLIPGAGGFTAIVPTAYTSTVAFGSADTFASEIGVLSPNPMNIVGGGRVRAGTNGGVSMLGELAALLGSALTALFGVAAFYFVSGSLEMPVLVWIPLVTATGWLGCQVDSLAGATLENRGLLGKNGVNMLSMLATAGIAMVVVHLL